MSTTAQLAQYCADHFPTTKGHLKMTPDYIRYGIDAAIVVGAYMVGRVGLPTFWSDLKTLYSKVRGWFAQSTVTSTQPA